MFLPLLEAPLEFTVLESGIGGDNIKMDLQEVGCEGMDWIQLAQQGDIWRPLVSAVMNLRVP